MKNSNTSKKFSFKKIAVTIVAVIFVLFLVIDIAVGNYLVNYAIKRSGDGGNRNVSLDIEPPKDNIEALVRANTKLQNARNDEFVAKSKIQETYITSKDKLKLKGFYALNEKPSDLWMIGIHGYRSKHTGMITFAERYYEKGFNVLIPDMRSCGESEGQYVGMGWKDKDDIQQWILWILEQNPDAKIVIHGHSMGGATTMMLSGDKTPENVVAFVEDCGYTSVWDIFASELNLRFHLPTFPILYTASAIAKFKGGYTFGEASAIKQVKKCEKPMMFIHGTHDGFIPYEMLQKLYDAKPGTNKKILTVEGADHCKSAYLLYDEYWNEVFSFIEPYL